MDIHWYPGHMAKARKLIRESLKLVHVIFELLDARIPRSSRNPDIAALLAGKPRVVILNKTDLADPAETRLWAERLVAEGTPVVQLDSFTGRGFGKIPRAVREAAAPGRTGTIRGMVVGIPNVGKSTFINRLAGQKAAATGARPGVTRGKQWIRVAPGIELLDTPGVLWPRFDDREVALKLAATGALKEEAIDCEAVALWLLDWIRAEYPGVLKRRYQLAALPADSHMLLETIGLKRGLVVAGGRVDRFKAAVALLKEFREGRLGRFTLDKCPV
ncbi:ribosome biogenesis GTPase A [Thermodesulfitimonas autotrophica]|uniref:Ribosome biogenesis GTPase A n=1 Tax=Thermodesulfitimonas autotrophica TaxID=1894989 RepID=A0A3N5AT41_9THEO|nr:ribosome biogenesis GTPase YlqF [Thermodesulfitimonas autotrophica]RPF46800.1 ribosome biogenesis GTPase A [Thermodesulfitimonas autotrophica]